MNTALEYSTRVVQEGDCRCKKSTLHDLAYLTPLRIPLMNPVKGYIRTVAPCSSMADTMDEGRERDQTSRGGGLPTLPGLYLSTFQPSQRRFFRVHTFV